MKKGNHCFQDVVSNIFLEGRSPTARRILTLSDTLFAFIVRTIHSFCLALTVADLTDTLGDLIRRVLAYKTNFCFQHSGTMFCQLWWARIQRTMLAARRTVRTSTWTSSSRRKSSPSIFIAWTVTTSCTIRTFAGRVPASLSTLTSGAVFARCCTTTGRRNFTRTWTSGGEATGYARLHRGVNTTRSEQETRKILEAADVHSDSLQTRCQTNRLDMHELGCVGEHACAGFHRIAEQYASFCRFSD